MSIFRGFTLKKFNVEYVVPQRTTYLYTSFFCTCSSSMLIVLYIYMSNIHVYMYMAADSNIAERLKQALSNEFHLSSIPFPILPLFRLTFFAKSINFGAKSLSKSGSVDSKGWRRKGSPSSNSETKLS